MKYILVAFIILLVAGCSSTNVQIAPPESDKTLLTPEQQVEFIHRQNLQYILDGNAKAIANAYSENYRDMGGGPNGDGTTDMHNVEMWEDAFSEENEFRGKSIEEIVDLTTTEINTYPNITESQSSFVCNSTRIKFTCENGDVFIFFAPAPGSPLFDGWGAVYRKINNQWKIVAGD